MGNEHYRILLVLLECSFKFVHGYSSGKYVWPLSDQTFTYEIKNSIHGDYSQCGFNFIGTPPTGLTDTPLSLNGLSYPFVDIDIDDSNEFKSFSFAFFVKRDTTTGCLLHFKKNVPSSNTLNELRLCINGGQLTLHWSFGNGDQDSLSVGYSTNSNGWKLVILSRDYDRNSYDFRLQADEQENFISLASAHSDVLGLPGKLRIGSLHDGSSQFVGKFTCVVMYDTFNVHLSEESYVKLECSGSFSVSGLPSANIGCAVQGSSTEETTITTTATTVTTSAIATTTTPTTTTTSAIATTTTATATTATPVTTSAIATTTTATTVTTSAIATTTTVTTSAIATTTTATPVTTSAIATTTPVTTSAIATTTATTVPSSSNDNCSKDSMQGHFHLILSNEKPSVPALLTTTVSTSPRCASLCLRTLGCMTYSAMKLSSNSLECSLFDSRNFGGNTVSSMQTRTQRLSCFVV